MSDPGHIDKTHALDHGVKPPNLSKLAGSPPPEITYHPLGCASLEITENGAENDWILGGRGSRRAVSIPANEAPAQQELRPPISSVSSSEAQPSGW